MLIREFDGRTSSCFVSKHFEHRANVSNLVSSLDARLHIMADLAEVVEHIGDDFPFSILKDLNHNGLEMNPRLVLINETYLSQGFLDGFKHNKIKLILYPETCSVSNSEKYHGDIGDPR